jgi:hypothetical protein
MNSKVDANKKLWFSMWFLGSIVTFGIAFFPMFYRLVEGRNQHFRREAILEKIVANHIKNKEKCPSETNPCFTERKAKIWAASIILIVPIFIILYLLSEDLKMHEQSQDVFLIISFTERMFMPQTIPIQKYVLMTIATLGVGAIYWLYKVVNLYNAHYKAHLYIEKEITRLMGEEKIVE